MFLLAAVAIIGFSSIPFWLGRSAETDDVVFRGTYADTADYSVHVAMMRAGQQGEWTYQLRFTNEPHNPAFIRLFYVFLGHVSRWTNMDVEFVFHAARWFFGLTALFAIYRLFQKIYRQKSSAAFAFFLAVFGAGIGWLQLILGAPLEPISPIDLWLIDAYILFSISLFPSFSLTLTLMAAALYFFFDHLENEKTGSLIWVCLCAVISQLFNPIAFAVIDAAMAGAVIFSWWEHRRIDFRQLRSLIVIAAIQVPLLAYNLFVLVRDPIWSQFTLQNATLSPPPAFYLWGFAPFWIFAIFGAIRAIRERDPISGSMLVWVAGGFALAYLPVLIQRRFLLGITIPLSVLAIYGIQFVLSKLPARLEAVKKREGLIYFSYVLISSISSLFLILNASLFVQTRPVSLFYPRDLETAIQWLEANSKPNEFALASVETSQVIAQETHLQVYTGHEMETLYFDNKESAMRAYFNGTISDEWLSQTSIRWILYGPLEEALTPDFSPSPSLDLVYQNDSVEIYEVTK